VTHFIASFSFDHLGPHRSPLTARHRTLDVAVVLGRGDGSRVEWIEDGAYLTVRDEVDAGEIPSGTWIVGGDDASDECTALYYDSRGVRRVYGMSLSGGQWRIWRDAPGFNQRFFGKLASGCAERLLVRRAARTRRLDARRS
jgi:hypothetical protein